MNAEELKSKITFQTKAAPYGNTRLIGRLDLSREMIIAQEYMHREDVVEHCKDRIRHEIAKSIYNDQREAMHKAIYELYLCNPMDYSALRKACDKISALAKYQPNL